MHLIYLSRTPLLGTLVLSCCAVLPFDLLALYNGVSFGGWSAVHWD